jgi:hypothetical protein
LIAAGSTPCENRAHGDESCCATSDSHHARTHAVPLHHAGPLSRVNHYQNSLRLSASIGPFLPARMWGRRMTSLAES